MSLYRAKYAPLRPLLKAAVSTSEMWSKAVLTYPVVDLAGDLVAPGGLDFTTHQADPSIDLEHGRDPAVRGLPVAWARASLSEPGAPYAVEYKPFDLADPGRPPDVHSLPVGTSYFDQSCRVSSQVFALVEQDALPAVSLEFRAVPGHLKALGPSPLEPRQAYRFDRADVIRWTLCARGVCPGALALTKSLVTPEQVPGPLARILTDKRVNVGGRYEPLHAAILKALAPPPARRTAVRLEKAWGDGQNNPACPECGGRGHAIRSIGYAYGCSACGGSYGVSDSYRKAGWPEFRPHMVASVEGERDDSGAPKFIRFEPLEKAMPEPDDETPPDDATNADAAPAADLDTANAAAVDATAGGPTPTAQAAYDLSQGAKDLCAQIREGAGRGEHKGGRKKILALCQKLDTIAELAMGVGRQVDADLANVTAGDDDEPATDDADEGDDDDDEAEAEPVSDEDMEEDAEDGVLKGIPATYRKAVKRFRLADLEAPAALPAAESPAPGVDPADVAALKAQVARLAKKISIL